MHQVLYIPEILLNIFSQSCSYPAGGDLAVLARTCKTFKEPALDMLWETLPGLSPLARCLPEVCQANPEEIQPRRYRHRYSFSRPLNELEWNTLRGYTRRVRFIHSPMIYGGSLAESATRMIFNQAPFADPLFPILQSLYWQDVVPFALLHVAVPSLTLLDLNFTNMSIPLCTPEELIGAFGNRCPHIEEFRVKSIFYGPDDSLISRQICRWKNLQSVVCEDTALDMGAILHLSSLSNLNLLVFSVSIKTIEDVSDLRSTLVFSNLVDLTINFDAWEHTAVLLPRMRLPAIQSIDFHFFKLATRRGIQTCWAAIQEACPSNSLTRLELSDAVPDPAVGPIPIDEDFPPRVALEDLRPCATFSELQTLCVNFNQPVRLTDGDLLELVSPRMRTFVVNGFWGWGASHGLGSGITLSGLVHLLRHRPYLNVLCVAIDTATFTDVPEGLDVWYPQRKLYLNLVDSYIEPEFIPDLVLAFIALRVDPSKLTVWNVFDAAALGGETAIRLWDSVRDQLKNIYEMYPPSSQM